MYYLIKKGELYLAEYIRPVPFVCDCCGHVRSVVTPHTYRFGGTEFLFISGTGYKFQSGAWASEVLKHLGIPEAVVEKVYEPVPRMQAYRNAIWARKASEEHFDKLGISWQSVVFGECGLEELRARVERSRLRDMYARYRQLGIDKEKAYYLVQEDNDQRLDWHKPEDA